MLEFLNKVELRGVVGRADLTRVEGDIVARIVVVTESSHLDASGQNIVDTMWHNLVVWQSSVKTDLKDIARGDVVHLTGRLRYRRYVTEDGTEKNTVEVITDSLEKEGEAGNNI